MALHPNCRDHQGRAPEHKDRHLGTGWPEGEGGNASVRGRAWQAKVKGAESPHPQSLNPLDRFPRTVMKRLPGAPCGPQRKRQPPEASVLCQDRGPRALLPPEPLRQIKAFRARVPVTAAP